MNLIFDKDVNKEKFEIINFMWKIIKNEELNLQEAR